MACSRMITVDPVALRDKVVGRKPNSVYARAILVALPTDEAMPYGDRTIRPWYVDVLLRVLDIVDRPGAMYSIRVHLHDSELYMRRGLLGIELVWPYDD